MNVLYNLTNEKHFVKTINQWEFDYSLFTDLVRIAKFTNFSLSSFKLRFKLQILYSLQTTEMYLEPSWIFFMEFLCKNDKLFTVFVCVCVCVYALPPVGFFRLHDICDICEKFGSTIYCPSSLSPNLSYFTSKDENSSQLLTGEKTIWYNVWNPSKRWYILI